MDISAVDINSLLGQLECPVCLESCTPPIYQCVNGHNVCPSCRDRITECAICRAAITATRNRFAEHISQQLKIPPRISEDVALQYRCFIVLRYSEGYRQSDQCQWRGNKAKLLEHVKLKHKECFLTGDVIDVRCNVHTHLCYGTTYARFLYVFEELFWCMCFYNTDDSTLHLFTRYIGPDEIARDYLCEYELVSECGGRKLLYTSAPLGISENFRDESNSLQLNATMTEMFSEDGVFRYSLRVMRKKKVHTLQRSRLPVRCVPGREGS